MKILFFISVVLTAAGAFGETMSPVKDCDAAPNCVSTKATNPKRFIQPIIFNGPKSEFKKLVSEIIESMPRAKIVTAEDTYVHAEFTSSMMKFVDDFELSYDESKKMIDMRSSARVGYYDFGVNLKRCKEFEIEFLKKTRK